ncbi:protein LIFEGUARD 4-like [Argentina anserina]|uniref:protein LIFEGUARD 4-like n=1 Tax=Argentina anserina TaxID=57926 RepID=UPI00217630E7|nr:protein LIFEGUARD 4-like [Potentilla anserina]
MAITPSNLKSETDLDLEAGAARQLYPSMTENPQLRWAFIRKVYAILTVQLFITAAVAAAIDLVRPVAHFLAKTSGGLGVILTVFVLSLAVLFALFVYGKKHPVNYILMGLFTVLMGVIVGAGCAYTKEKVLLEAWGLTVVIFVTFTLYTFWAARRGYDFSFLGPFLFAALIVLLGFSLIQIFHPLGKTSHMIFGIVGCIIFCGYVVYDTDELIKRHQYDEYVIAAIGLYLDAINLFLSLITAIDS